MVEPATTRKAAHLGALRAIWQKYGLIVVGNVVFFALLYFLQYRPNSREARAAELLTMAQQQETDQKLEAAEVLYARITGTYADCEAGGVALQRLPKVQARLKQVREKQPPLPEACAAKIDLHALLALQPSFYLAELLAAYLPEVKDAERDRYFTTLDRYVWMALNQESVPLDKLRASPAFRAGKLQQRYFELKMRASLVEDVIYDDFHLHNESYFTWHNAVLDLTVTQGDDSEQGSLRVAALAPKAGVPVLEFRVRKDGGAVTVKGTITADEGKASFEQRL